MSDVDRSSGVHSIGIFRNNKIHQIQIDILSVCVFVKLCKSSITIPFVIVYKCGEAKIKIKRLISCTTTTYLYKWAMPAII